MNNVTHNAKFLLQLSVRPFQLPHITLDWPSSSRSLKLQVTAIHRFKVPNTTNELILEQSRKLNTIQICLSHKKHPLSENQWTTRLVRGAVLELNGPIKRPITVLFLRRITRYNCPERGSLRLVLFWESVAVNLG